MTTRYVDLTLVTGNNDGTSWVHAHQGVAGFQTALTAAVAGDEVAVTHNGTLASALTLNAVGSTAAGPIKVVGYNYNSGSPINDGTLVVLDGSSKTFAGFSGVSKTAYWWENLAVTRATTAWSLTSSSYYHMFLNCQAYNNGISGFTGYTAIFILCAAYDNSNNGFSNNLGTANYFACVSARNNYGFLWKGGCAINCVGFSNTNANFIPASGGGNLIVNCVSDAAASGIAADAFVYPTAVISSRLTNALTAGFNAGTLVNALALWNYLGNTTNTSVSGAGSIVTAALGVAQTNLLAAAPVGVGYRNRAANMFHMVLGAAGYRFVLPTLYGGSQVVINRGLSATPIVD